MAANELTAGQEAFCLAYLETGNAAEAYRRAYDKPPEARDNWIYVEASQMLDHPKISLRLKELQAQAAKLSLYNVKAAFDELEDARVLANKVLNPSAAVAAVQGKIKLFGLDKPVKQIHSNDPENPMPDGSAAVNALKAHLDAIADRIAGQSSEG